MRDWLRLMPDADAGAAESAGRDLLDRWGEPHRRYHNVDHLSATLSTLDDLGASPAARLAAWYHDAVYDPQRPDNEERSAVLAARMLPGLGLAEQVPEVVRLIRLTAGHDPAPDDRDGIALCDADLAVLAWPRHEYDGYAGAIRAEYAHVPDEAYRAGRAGVLRGLLGLPALYRTPELHACWEEPARANLRRELATLADRPSA
ncbi:HD domain-containing protein [Rugosimonospora africana]|nr:metal-dependent phosphohydrolase [Rugosimonospora africana]